MGFRRRAVARHDTEAVRAHGGVDSSTWWEFQPGERIVTRDYGRLPGVVVRVEDGPVAGNEHYIVELDGHMGGGEFGAGELMKVAARPHVVDASVETAAVDYPMLGDILYERPPPPHSRVVTSARLTSAADPYEGWHYKHHVEFDGRHGHLLFMEANGWEALMDDGTQVAFGPDETHLAIVGERDDDWFPGQVRGKLAAVVARDYEGRAGNREHITRKEDGMLPIAAVAHLMGARGEVPGEHRNKQGQAWEAFKEDIRTNGIQNAIFITVDPREEPKISEGNHRRDAAVELGLEEVPVEIRYFGKAEEQGTVASRAGLQASGAASSGEWQTLTKPIRARLRDGLPGAEAYTDVFGTQYPAFTEVPAGAEGVVKGWRLGETVPVWRPDGNVKVKTNDVFLVAFPSVGVPGVILTEDQIELLDPIPRRKTANIEDPCTACGGTGAQPTGPGLEHYECYLCDGSGEGAVERSSRAHGLTNANPENGLLVGQDLSIGQMPVTAALHIASWAVYDDAGMIVYGPVMNRYEAQDEADRLNVERVDGESAYSVQREGEEDDYYASGPTWGTTADPMSPALPTGLSSRLVEPQHYDGAFALTAEVPVEITSKEAGILDRVLDRIDPHPGETWSVDWCRFRRQSHCFSGDTEFLTYDGYRIFKEVVGTEQTVLTSTGEWVEADVLSFGDQPLYKIVLQRWGQEKIIFATAEHRWFVYGNGKVKGQRLERVTKNLLFGDVPEKYGRPRHKILSIDSDERAGVCGACGPVRLYRRHKKLVCANFVNDGNKSAMKRKALGLDGLAPSLCPGDRLAVTLPRSDLSKWDPDPTGIIHGIAFGDGHRAGNPEKRRGNPTYLNLWGEKDAELLRYFSQHPQHPLFPDVNQGRSVSGVQISGMPRFFKDRPSLDEAGSYLYGWLAGYFAADGSLDASGSGISISCADRSVLEFVQAVCNRLTIATYALTGPHEALACSGRGALHEVRVRRGNGACSYCAEQKMATSYTLPFVAQTLRPEFFLLAEHRRRFEQRDLESTPPLAWEVVSVEKTDRTEEVYCLSVPETHNFVLQDWILTGNCFYPKTLDADASKQAGYAVWTPVDRGYCPRIKWPDQQMCPVAEPGPHSGSPQAQVDATIPWQEGGQRGGHTGVLHEAADEEWATLARAKPGDYVKAPLGGVVFASEAQARSDTEYVFEKYLGVVEINADEKFPNRYQPGTILKFHAIEGADGTVRYRSRDAAKVLIRRTGALHEAGRFLCPGSNTEPVPPIPESIDRIEGTADTTLPGTRTTIFHPTDYGICPVCHDPKRKLKSGLLPKHDRYLSWQDQEAMRARGEDPANPHTAVFEYPSFPAYAVIDGIDNIFQVGSESTYDRFVNDVRIEGHTKVTWFASYEDAERGHHTAATNVWDVDEMIDYFDRAPERCEHGKMIFFDPDSECYLHVDPTTKNIDYWETCHSQALASHTAVLASDGTVHHIRRRMPQSQSTNSYLDRRDLSAYAKTFCGADITDKDQGWAQRKTKWTKANACPACVEAVDREEQGTTASLEDDEFVWHFTAAWKDVRDKAKRIKDEGGVRIVASNAPYFTGHVQGDTDVYETTIMRTPGRKSVAMWECFLPDAPVMMADGTEKSISEVSPGDEVWTHAGRVQRVVKVAPKRYDGDIVRLRINGDTSREIIATANHPMWAMDPSQHEVGFVKIGDLAGGDYLAMPIPVEETPASFVVARPSAITSRYPAVVTDVNVKVDEEIAWLLGWYVAEGHARKESYEVGWTLGANERAVAERILDICEKHFGVRGSIIDRQTRLTCRVSHWALHGLVTQVGGTGALYKHLHASLLTLPLSEQRVFMEAWVQGDGHEEDRGVTVLHSASSRMMRQAKMILARLGYAVSLRTYTQGGGPTNRDRECEITRIQWATRGRGSKRLVLRDGQVWHRVVGVEREHYEGEVWDLEVECGDHSFMAYGMAVANCGCKWANYSWARSGRWKKYEGRMCAHALALNFEVQSRGAHGRDIREDREAPQWAEGLKPVPSGTNRTWPTPWRTSSTIDSPSPRTHWLIDDEWVPKEPWEIPAPGRVQVPAAMFISHAGDYNGHYCFDHGAQALVAARKKGEEPEVHYHDGGASMLCSACLNHGTEYVVVSSTTEPHEVGDDPSLQLSMHAAMQREASAVGKVRGFIHELLALLPGRKVRIDTGDEVDAHEILYVSFHPTLGLSLSDRRASLGASNGPVGSGGDGLGVVGLGTAGAADDPGVMIAVRPPQKLCEALAEIGTEDIDQLHVTVLYLGKQSEVPNLDALPSAVGEWAARWGSFPALISGFGFFGNGGDKVLVALIDTPGFDRARTDLMDTLARHHITWADNHGWSPHLTLKYLSEGEAPELPEITDDLVEEFVFDSVIVAVGPHWEHYGFGNGHHDPRWEDAQTGHLVASLSDGGNSAGAADRGPEDVGLGRDDGLGRGFALDWGRPRRLLAAGEPDPNREPRTAYGVTVTPEALADYRGLSATDKRAIRKAVGSLKHSSTPQGFKGLTGPLSGFLEIQVGDSLRVVYGVSGRTITVVGVGQHENFHQKVIRRVKGSVTAGKVKLYHGTGYDASQLIDREGIKPNDMGMVYATNDEERAEMWARRQSELRGVGDGPVVVEFEISESKLSEASRPGDFVIWGKVPASAITSIWEVDEEGPRFEASHTAAAPTGLSYKKIDEQVYEVTDTDGLSVVIHSAWNQSLGIHWRCDDPETLDLQRGWCAKRALTRLRERQGRAEASHLGSGGDLVAPDGVAVAADRRPVGEHVELGAVAVSPAVVGLAHDASGLAVAGVQRDVLDLGGGHDVSRTQGVLTTDAHWHYPPKSEALFEQASMTMSEAQRHAQWIDDGCGLDPNPNGSIELAFALEHSAAANPPNVDWCKECGLRIVSPRKGVWRHMRPQPSGEPHEHNAQPGGTKREAQTVDTTSPLGYGDGWMHIEVDHTDDPPGFHDPLADMTVPREDFFIFENEVGEVGAFVLVGSQEDAGAEATLHDEPEPALPSTDGGDPDLAAVEEERTRAVQQARAGAQGTSAAPELLQAPVMELDPERFARIAATGIVDDDPLPRDDLEPVSESSGETRPQGLTSAYDGARAGALTTPGAPGVPSDVQLPSWLNPGGATEGSGADLVAAHNADKESIAAMAQMFLKEGAKAFSLAEQQALINEGEGVRAANLDRLDIADTHYALQHDDDEDDLVGLFG